MKILRRLWDFLMSLFQESSPKETIEEIEFIPIEPMKEELKEESLNDKLIRIADALTLLNTDITPDDKTPDEVACVESLVEVLNKVVSFPRETYTPYLVRELKKHPRVMGTLDFNEASIIVNATGTGNGTMRGHCGIIGRGDEIISNNSSNGKWEYNYTIKAWQDRFQVKGGMPTQLFKLI